MNKEYYIDIICKKDEKVIDTLILDVEFKNNLGQDMMLESYFKTHHLDPRHFKIRVRDNKQ